MDFSLQNSNSQEEQKYQSIQHQQKRNRRKKDSSEQRDYYCGCGKQYLSYAALYTHLKQKHDGQQPPGTFEPTHGKGRKGRPKNEQYIENDSFDSNELNDLSDYECGDLDEMLYFLKNVGKNLRQELNEEPLILTIELFPQQIFYDQEIYRKIFKYFISFINRENLEQQQQQQQQQQLEIPLNKVFAEFLRDIFEFVTFECFEELVIFVCGLSYLINKHSQEICSLQNIQFCGMECEFCEKEEMTQYIYHFIASFKAEFWNIIKIITRKENFQLIGNESNSLYLFKHFINWMHYKNYVQEQIEID